MVREQSAGAIRRGVGGRRNEIDSPQEWYALDTETHGGKACWVGWGREEKYGGCLIRKAEDWLQAVAPGWYVAWNLGYDAQALFAWFPEKNLEELYYRAQTDWEGWRIAYKARKEFTWRPLVRGGERMMRRVYDAQPYYGCRLADVAEKIGLAAGKASIPHAWYQRMDAIMEGREGEAKKKRAWEYALQDVRVTWYAWSHVRTQFERIGLRVARPFSTATWSVAYFGDRMKFLVPRWQQRLFQRTYYGGRIECYRRGNVGRTWSYDLNSAYPAALAKLVDPQGARLDKVRRIHADAIYAAYRVRVQIPLEEPFGPVPYRGAVLTYPVGSWWTWVDQETMQRLLSLGWIADFAGGWALRQERRAVPLFPDIGRLYAERKKNPELSLAIKLVLNGLYGKLAQEVSAWRQARHLLEDDLTLTATGEAWKRIRRSASHTHFALAAAVTAHVRWRVWDMMRSVAPEHVVFVSTDGVTLTTPSPLPTGAGLGEWGECDRANETIVVGTGFYSQRFGDEWETKGRGFSAHLHLPSVLDRARSRVVIPTLRAEQLAQCVKRKNYGLLNVLSNAKRVLDVNFDRKRVWQKDWKSARDVLQSTQSSEPWIVVEK